MTFEHLSSCQCLSERVATEGGREKVSFWPEFEGKDDIYSSGLLLQEERKRERARDELWSWPSPRVHIDKAREAAKAQGTGLTEPLLSDFEVMIGKASGNPDSVLHPLKR